ncbi:MAG: hypothetical protein ACTSUQ_09600 [Candidatus Freyarchaeota archaeon]
MIVSNATPLIYLSKINMLHLLKKKFAKVLLPRKVWEEVVERGKLDGHPDAYLVEEAVREGWIQVVEANEIEAEKIAKAFRIHRGEAEAILLAKKKKTQILLDQTHARETAKILKLTPRGTIYVLRLAYRNKLISREKYLKLIDKLVENNFCVLIELYLEARKIDNERKTH